MLINQNYFVLLFTYNLLLNLTQPWEVSPIPFHHSRKIICEKDDSLVYFAVFIKPYS